MQIAQSQRIWKIFPITYMLLYPRSNIVTIKLIYLKCVFITWMRSFEIFNILKVTSLSLLLLKKFWPQCFL